MTYFSFCLCARQHIFIVVCVCVVRERVIYLSIQMSAEVRGIPWNIKNKVNWDVCLSKCSAFHPAPLETLPLFAC